MNTQPGVFTGALKMDEVPIMQLRARLKSEIGDGNRLGLLTAADGADGHQLLTLIIQTQSGGVSLLNSPLPHDAVSYASLTPDLPQAHWFEREIADLWGIRPVGHPRLKSLVMHDSYPTDLFPLAEHVTAATARKRSRRAPYRFTVVQGNGVFEVPVGPVHAGIIEPGHFRFSCLGEVIENLEIRLGFVHRGLEERLTRCDWRMMNYLVEAASSDTAAANATAHAFAMENLCSVPAAPDVRKMRYACIEIERAACHIGDLVGICTDLGFGAGGTAFSALRGDVLGVAELLTGTRFMTSVIVPFAHKYMPAKPLLIEATRRLRTCSSQLRSILPLLLNNGAAIERMEGMGDIKTSLARDFGLVGPAGRASGIAYDVRKVIAQPEYEQVEWQPPTYFEGDVFARTRVRAEEAIVAMELAADMVSRITSSHEPDSSPATLPANSVGVGIVEAWRGELIHLVMTDSHGRVSRYKIKDPSFNNWTALSIAVRGRLLSDFPLCNKSFGLSYSGTDL